MPKLQKPTYEDYLNERGGKRCERQCEVCGDTFYPRVVDVESGGGKHCSTNCSSKVLRKKKWNDCKSCGAEFETVERSRSGLCGDCRHKKACAGCGRLFLAKGRKYCSQSCMPNRPRTVCVEGFTFPLSEAAKKFGLRADTVARRAESAKRRGKEPTFADMQRPPQNTRSKRPSGSGRDVDWDKVDWSQPLVEIARQTGLSTTAVRSHGRRLGTIEVRTRKVVSCDWANVNWALSNAEIAATKGVSPSTVRYHRQRAGQKKTYLIGGVRASEAEIAEAFGVSVARARGRLEYGWLGATGGMFGRTIDHEGQGADAESPTVGCDGPVPSRAQWRRLLARM